ncbi:STAS/SEC14 domain-containing protein [Bacillus tianshenii]|nr:STAS/SEC14 domain-containing protein [Bacillus tianshenii]
MISIKPNHLEQVIEIEVEGKIMKHDIEEFETYMEQKREDGEKLDLLMEIRELDGYTMKGLMEELKFDTSHWNDFNKIAVISEKQWVEFSTKMSGILPKVEVKHFKPGERDVAIDWLRNI